LIREGFELIPAIHYFMAASRDIKDRVFQLDTPFLVVEFFSC